MYTINDFKSLVFWQWYNALTNGIKTTECENSDVQHIITDI